MIYGKGSFPLYFQKPDKTISFFDKLGFSNGFKRSLPDGTSFYIHKAKNKRDTLCQGFTFLLFTEDLAPIIEILKEEKLDFQQSLWLDLPCLDISLHQSQKMKITLKDKNTLALPKEAKYQALECKTPIIASGYLSINALDPQENATWYQSHFNAEIIYQSENLCINTFTNIGSKEADLIIYHQKVESKKDLGPNHYKNFCLKTNDIYDCWRFLQDKKLLNPRWKSPEEDGPWRTVTITGPNGYPFKIYGSMNIYSEDETKKILSCDETSLDTFIASKKLISLKSKYLKNLHLAEDQKKRFFPEDAILRILHKSNPYAKELPEITSGKKTNLLLES